MRRVVIQDYQFIHECYQDWPLTDKGPVTVDVAVGWTRRWMTRTDEMVLILEDGGPVGLIKWREDGDKAVIDNIVVHPDHRGKGYASRMMRELQARLGGEGIKVASFDALPGKIADMTLQGRFQKVGEKTGNTGLPLVVGEVTAEQKI